MTKKAKQQKAEKQRNEWLENLTEDEALELDADTEMFGAEDAEYFLITGCRDD